MGIFEITDILINFHEFKYSKFVSIGLSIENFDHSF